MTTTTTTIGGGTLTVTPKTEPYNEQQNYGAFAVIKSDGSVFAWGNKDSGGDISSVASQLDGTIPVTQIFTNGSSFAALRSDGSVVTWGSKDSGGDSSAVSSQLNGDIDVTQIFSNGSAFAAIRSDGSVVSWGSGGWDSATNKQVQIDTSSVASQLNGSIPVTHIFSDGWNTFAALRADGSVVTWGDNSVDSSSIANALNGDIDVISVHSNWSEFAALRVDGSVISWGIADSDYSTTPATQTLIDTNAVASQLGSGVKHIQSIENMMGGGFIAIKADGSVFAWGAKDTADISSVADQLNGTIPVKKIYSDDGMMSMTSAVAALREDGSVISWGSSAYEVPIDSIAVASELNGTNPVKQIYSSAGMMATSFAALRADGSVFTWGDKDSGGDSSTVASQLNGTIDVKEIYSGNGAFAALRVDGSVVSWGYGGYEPITYKSLQIDTSTVADKLNGKIDVTNIYSNNSGFAALRVDGSVVTWGQNNDSSAVASDLNGDIDVKEIYSNGNGFAALRADGSVVIWGMGDTYDSATGKYIPFDSKAISEQLTDVVSFANPATDDVYIAPAKEIHINHTPTGNITITGTATQAQTLTIKNTLADSDGLGDFGYQWLSNGAEIFGATDASYLLSVADIGKKISVQVSYLDGEGTEEFVTSNATTAVLSNVSTKATSGNDQISGTAKAEKLDGLAGNDLIKGLAGNDTLIGGAGLDTLIGGAGADVLTGGADSDIFKFIALADSGITSKTRDTITDFKSFTDKIDLSVIDANEKITGDQAFTFIGTAAFNKTNASAQLRFDATSKILYGSTDADTAPEFSIQLNGVSSLAATDFVL